MRNSVMRKITRSETVLAFSIAVALSWFVTPLQAQTEIEPDAKHELPSVKSQNPAASMPGALPLGMEQEMDHDKMQMQGGDVPPNARNPHGYSNGFTLEQGPYALPGTRLLRMADEHQFWALMADRFEYDSQRDSILLDLLAWYGNSYDRLQLEFEAEATNGHITESQTQLLWGHAISAYFDTQLGARIDQYQQGPRREWLALGLQGLAPYWFELDLAAYLGGNGRTALSLKAEYELLLSQKLILQPRTEWTFYGKDDPEHNLGSGLAEATLGLRLRYEFSRQFAPYIGIEWTRKFGATAEYSRTIDETVSDTLYVAGIRFWF